METTSPSILHDFLRKNYPLGGNTALQLLTSGEENRNFLVNEGGERYVLRVYSIHHSTTGSRKRAEVEFELDFMEAAHAHGVPTPPVIYARSGSRVTTLSQNSQSHFAVLFGYAQGREPAEYAAQTAHAAAGALLALRRASMSFGRTSPRPWPGNIIRLSLDYYAANQDRIIHRRDTLDRLYQSASTGYAQILAASLPNGVIHGDVKLGNLLFQGDHLIAVIDFDDYRETYLLEEFTRTVMHDLDSPSRNVIRAGFYPVFHDALAADPTATRAEIDHISTFLRARLVYDLASYTLAGHNGLVDEVLSDSNMQAVLLARL